MKSLDLLLAAFAMAALPARGQIYTYELLPGSTVTPMNGANVTGPAEQLTGEFQIQPYAIYPYFNVDVYQFTSLNLASSSYSFNLLGDTQENLSLGLGSQTAEPNVDVSVSGLSIGSGTIQYYPNPGSYVGSYSQPTEIDFSTLRMAPVQGGNWAAEFTINAVLVPEPSAPALASLALLVVFFRRRAKQADTGQRWQFRDRGRSV